MSLENEIKKLTDVVVILTAKIEMLTGPTVTDKVEEVKPVIVETPVVPAPQPAAPAPQSVAPAQVTEMPPTPTFEAPVAQPAAKTAPFSDVNGMISYATQKYQALGADKGSKIQAIIEQIVGTAGAPITEIKPEQFNEFFEKVEAL